MLALSSFMLTRFQAVELLWEGTELSVSAAFCALAVVERTGGFPVGHLRLGAAAAMAYKAHHCTPFDRMSEFVEYMLVQEWPARPAELAAEEMCLLERLGFCVPMHQMTAFHATRQTDRETDSHTDRQTDRQTDR